MPKMKSAIRTKICGGCMKPNSEVYKMGEPEAMLKSNAPFMVLLILLILCGCTVGTQIQGQSYLDQEKYS